MRIRLRRRRDGGERLKVMKEKIEKEEEYKKEEKWDEESEGATC